MTKLKAAVIVLLFSSCSSYASPGEDAWNRSVAVEIGTLEKRMGTCSGVILRTDLVLTAAHCAVGDVFKIGSELGTVVKVDKPTDLMLLKVKTKPFRMVPFGDVKMAQEVLSVPLFEDFGKVLLFGRVAVITSDQIWVDMKAMPGISGSGLFDLDGRLVGLNNRFALHQSDITVVLVGVSVPAKTIREFLKGVESK